MTLILLQEIQYLTAVKGMKRLIQLMYYNGMLLDQFLSALIFGHCSCLLYSPLIGPVSNILLYPQARNYP
jgi:hypothetical protein